jgi:Trypsin-like peptidase domain/Colicin V production protein
MTAIDWIIVVVAIGFGVWGYGHGLIVGALTLAGFAGGAVLGSRVGPTLLEGGSESPYAPLTALLGGLILGALFAVTMEGLAQGLRTRFVRRPAGGVVDAVGGSVLFAALALGLAWVFGAVALHTPGARDLRSAVQESAILRGLNELLPPSGPVLNVLNRIDPTPEVRGPEAKVAAPDAKIARDPEVRAAADGVVRVLGTACGLGVAGSGWVAGPGVVVTDAHVVAGQDDTTVTTLDGAELDATAVHYEPRNDVAVLAVDGLDAPALPFGEPRSGTEAAVLGYPENGPLTISPARLGSTGTALSEDSYGRGPVERLMTPFRAEVRSGNSGGPVVDADGGVLTTVFAAAVGSRRQSGLGVPNEIVQQALERSADPVDTGPCVA